MLSEAAQSAMAAQGALPDFGAELAHPAMNRRSIAHDPALGQHVTHIAIRQRAAAAPAHRQQDHVLRKPMPTERIMIAPSHYTPPLLAILTYPQQAANATVPPEKLGRPGSTYHQ